MIPYIIKSFRGGVSDENDKGVAGSFKHGHALNIHDQNDILTGKQAMATVFGNTQTTQTGITQFFVPASDGTTYCFGSTGSIFAISGDTLDPDWTYVYSDENGGIRGAAEWELDTGVNYLYWATATSVSRKELAGAEPARDSHRAYWTDVTLNLKTTLNNVEWHTMKNASGVLNIANGQSLATVDFAGSFDANKLNIRPGNLIKAIDERDDYSILGSERLDKSEEGHLWSWITTATNWVQKKRIPVKGVNSIIDAEIRLLQGGDDGELFFSDFVNAVPLHGIPGKGKTDPTGAAIENDLAVFGIYGSSAAYPGIWSYGRKRKNRPFALNYEYRLASGVTGSTISTTAAVAIVDGSLITSWGTTDGSVSEFGVDMVSSTTKATALYEGLEFDGGVPYLKKIFDTVKVTMTPLVSGTSISVKYRTDKATSGGDSSAGAGWKYAVLGGGSTTFSDVDETEAIFTIGDSANVYEVGLELNPSSNDSPEILSITTYLSNENYEF